MAQTGLTNRISAITQRLQNVITFMEDRRFSERNADPLACDFALGNPHEMPLPGFVEALQRWTMPQNKDWFAYKMSEPETRETVAESLRQWRGVNFDPQDIFMTSGAWSAIAVALCAVLDPGDEVIFISPPWFFYETLILWAGGVPVRVKIDLQTFDLDLNAIEAAITSRTRAIIINTPNNPTGKIYPETTLKNLAQVLNSAMQKANRPIFMLSDESYSKIIFDGRKYYSPTSYYPYSFLLYTYGKILLTPGQRIGYIALPPEMPEADPVRQAVFVSQMMNSYAFPNALLQHALPDLEKLSIDIDHLQVKRDQVVKALQGQGYDLHSPEGTFYLLPRSPLEDDLAFINSLADHHIYCLPGRVAEMPGYFRISLTANDAMIERSLPGFAAALEQARQASLMAAH